MTLEVLDEMPEAAIFIIPVKLDECEAPQAISKLHWIGLFETTGFERLRKAIDNAYGTSKLDQPLTHTTSGWHEFLEDAIAKGGLIHLDPWQIGRSEDEIAFKKILKDRWNTSFDLLQSCNFEAIIELWQPLENNSFFRVDHLEWQDKPYFRAQVHVAKCHLFYSHAKLGGVHIPERFRQAFNCLQELLLGNPYSLKGGSIDRLTTEGARAQNLNYKDTLTFAQDWFRLWKGHFYTAGITDERVEAAQSRILDRLSEIDFMVKRFPESPND